MDGILALFTLLGYSFPILVVWFVVVVFRELLAGTEKLLTCDTVALELLVDIVVLDNATP